MKLRKYWHPSRNINTENKLSEAIDIACEAIKMIRLLKEPDDFELSYFIGQLMYYIKYDFNKDESKTHLTLDDIKDMYDGGKENE